MYFDKLAEILNLINDYLYSNILVFMLIFTGVFFSFYLAFPQLHIKNIFKILLNKPKEKNLSSYEAFLISSGAKIGVGNIIGVSIAISTGGSGAIFWMWVFAFFGAASAFCESTLAQIYKRKDDKKYYGGVAFYIKYGLGLNTLAICFAIFLILADIVGFNALLGFSIKNHLDFKYSEILITLVAAFIFFNGISFGKKIVPFMIVSYLLLALYVFIRYFDLNVILQIFYNAFNLNSAGGGLLGSVIVIGAKRGLFSNEAGMGSAPNVAASVECAHPCEQGFVQSFSVLMDLLVCTASAVFVLFAKGNYEINEAFRFYFGNFGSFILSFFIILFCLTSFYGNYYYSKANLLFITQRKTALIIFNIIAILCVFMGTLAELKFVWNLADFLMFFTTIINLIAIFMLRKLVLKSIKNYKSNKDFKELNTSNTPAWN